ncbi:FAD-binding oxidoreductase [uncultured Clostridium sp.]|uniref:FAD-binding oxidoreductase n=1 Tax=uncultured Clostridium sp. TaxID=59620 RepID=UPI002607FF20|nr:FAD-binding oxidoreductase [uncultured Clostridium sp.]
MENLNDVQVWKGFKDFVVDKKVMENADISSLYLKPVDGQKVVLPKAGQFVPLKINSGNERYDVVRAYSLSNKPNTEFYKVTIRKVEDGRASVYLTDIVQEGDIIGVRPPAGKFFLDGNADLEKPLVLLGAGIGITPVLSMLHEAVGKRKNIKYIEIFRNSEYQVLHEEIEEYIKNGLVDNTVVYTRPMEENIQGKDYDLSGYLTKEWIMENLPKDGEYYFCGPKPFLLSTEESLKELGVAEEDINYESF